MTGSQAGSEEWIAEKLRGLDPSWSENEALLARSVHGHADAAGGCQLHFWITGPSADSGAPPPPRVLLLEGMGSTHIGWLSFATVLTKKGWQAMILDNRGVGLSVTKDGGVGAGIKLTIKQMASDTLEALRCAGWIATDSPKIHVAGVSMGGMIAQELVAMAPELFASVSFVSTRAGGNLWSRLPSWGTCAAMLKAPFVHSSGNGDVAARMREAENACRMVFGRQYLAEHMDQAVAMMLLGQNVAGGTEIPASTVSAQAMTCLQHDGFALLAAIREANVPSQVLIGTDDPMINPAFSRAMAAELHCPLHEAFNAGHVLIEECPDWFREKMIAFIQAAHDRKSLQLASPSPAAQC